MTKREMHSYSNSIYRRSQLTLENLTLDEEIIAAKETAHTHDNIEYLLILKGQGTLCVNGEKYRIQPDDFIRLFPFHVHYMVPAEPISILRLTFPLSLLVYQDMSRQFEGNSLAILECGSPVIPLNREVSERVSDIYYEIKTELKNQEYFYERFILADTMKLISIYERQSFNYGSHDTMHSLLWQVLQYMHIHFNSSAAEVAKAFDISVPYLNYLFRSITGSNFSENRHQVRIRNACSMMQFEELSIAFIANYVGYHPLSTFYRVFREIKGMTPEEYRKKTPSSENYHSDTAWQILLYLFEHYTETLDIQTVAKHFFVSQATLSDILKRNYGMGFSKLLTSIRLVYVRALLTGTELPVYDIAMSCGFHSIRTFRRNFSEDVGMTPTEYREMQ